MSNLYFEESYVIVEPYFSGSEMHKHSFLHIFAGNDIISVLTENGTYTGNLIFIPGDAAHCAPQGDVNCILLIDPTSTIAESIQSNYLRDNVPTVLTGDFYSGSESSMGKREDVICMLTQLGLLTAVNKNRDKRIQCLIDEIKAYKFVGNKVSEIAEIKHYSESRLAHLFKRETGITLKGYLLLRQVELVCKLVNEGMSITESALNAGFASPSHFAAVFKQMTGISLSNVNRAEN